MAVGSVTAVDAAGFGFAMEGGGNVYLSWASVPVERSVGRGSRAKAGGLIGMFAGAGVLAGVALSESPGSGGALFSPGGGFVSTDRAVGLALALGGLVGGLLGAFIGSAISTEAWAPVEPGAGLSLQHSPAPAARARLAVAWTVPW